MPNPTTDLKTQPIDIALVSLVVLDVTLAAAAFLFPDLWYWLFHGTEYFDPQGLLRRTGAGWLGFAVVQFLAFLKWRAHPHWLAVAAGVRLSDMFTDWTYLAFAQNTTWFAWCALLLASPANLWLGAFFLRSYERITQSASATQPRH